MCVLVERTRCAAVEGMHGQFIYLARDVLTVIVYLPVLYAAHRKLSASNEAQTHSALFQPSSLRENVLGW